MLILSRRPGESIQIGDVTITVSKIFPHRVKLGIEAPSDVSIMRSELIGRPPPDELPPNSTTSPSSQL